MRALIAASVLAAGAAAAFLYLRTPAPSYVAPKLAPTAYEPAPTSLARAAAPGETLRVFEVHGMCCKGCTGKLYESLTSVDGVRGAAVDFDAGTASVLADEKLEAAAIERALNFDKYTAALRR